MEEARLAAEAEASKTVTPVIKTEPGVVAVQPDITAPKAGETPAMQTDARAVKAQQLFGAVVKETAPLLTQNKFADAIALLERKAKDAALADAAELLKQEKADVEAVVELRRSAIEALRKQVGQQVSLKKGGAAFKGKVVNDPKPDVVTLDMGGAQMTFTATMLSLEDVDQYAPRTGNVGADLRQRGIMYLAAGNVAKAKEYFSKPQTLNPEPYLDRLTALELGEIEAAALGAWNRAEALFDRKAMKEAKDAYDAFTKQHGQTKTAAGKTALLKERYDAVEAVIGPAKEITLDLAGVKMEMVLVKAGEFDMGSNDGDGNEKPVHKIAISQPYYLGKYEVTVAQFRAFADATKYVTVSEKESRGWGWKNGKWDWAAELTWRTPGFEQTPDHPVVFITWQEAQDFCNWATKTTGRTVRLPTEAEWEYAARGPQGRKYPWGDKEDWTLLNHADAAMKNAGIEQKWGSSPANDGFAYTAPVGSYRNAGSWCGAFDMAGNVWEWCQDNWNDKYYGESPAVDPQGPATGRDHVLRGGCWYFGPTSCRSARRNGLFPGRGADNGFRVVVGCGSSRTP